MTRNRSHSLKKTKISFLLSNTSMDRNLAKLHGATMPSSDEIRKIAKPEKKKNLSKSKILGENA